MKQLPIRASADFINDSWFQVDKHTSRNMFARTSFTEERVECIVTTSNCFVAWHLPIGLNAMLKAEKFPASIPYLTARLAQMNTDRFPHDEKSTRILWQKK